MNLNRMWRRYDRLLGPDVASDVNQELRFHIEAKAESLMAQGWAEDEARKEAERQFGNLGALQGEGERIGNRIERRERLREYSSDVLQDTRYGLRKLAKSPGFALFAILTLALGIGLCSVIFAFLNGALAPLPAVPEPERLAIMQAPIPYPWFKTYQGDGHAPWKAAAFMSPAPFNVSFEGEGSERVTGIIVSPEYFETLGVHPQLGRFFNTLSEREGSAPVVVVTERFWRTRLHSDPHSVGRRLRINGSVVQIPMRQKVLIAAALLHNPDLLLLDEPFSGLDVSSALVLRSLIQELAARGKVVLFSSHELDTVERVSTRVVILHRGKLVADDSIAHLRSLMELPTLEAIFSQLAVEQDTDSTARQIADLIHA